MPVPTHDKLLQPLLEAMHALGGSASIAELEDQIAKKLSLSDRDLSEIHRGTRTKFSYRLAWARTYLKLFGVIQNSDRGVWSLTATGSKTTIIDPEEVKRAVKSSRKEKPILPADADKDDPVHDGWELQLLEIVKGVEPTAFERLCQRLLRECGFIHVEVTGRAGDGGIDGKGVIRVGGLLSFHVIFQCKRYKNSVSSSVVRDFRGAMVGRADKGLIITTGTFTRDARAEAQRDGATPIDLVDGDELVEKLKELRIGVDVKTRSVEEVILDRDYFNSL